MWGGEIVESSTAKGHGDDGSQRKHARAILGWKPVYSVFENCWAEERRRVAYNLIPKLSFHY
jgi:hypothetical protein